MGVKEPRADARNAFRRLLIVPLACFDRRGGRVGYGKGHFDRTIAALAARRPVLAIGLGYAIQEIPEVPLEPHDRRLDFIVTDPNSSASETVERLMRLLLSRRHRGPAGRNVVIERLPALRERWRLDCVVINGENAAGGFGITEAICDEILAAGADAITLGNHSWDQREALVFIERQPRLLRPLNYPAGTPAAAPTSSTLIRAVAF